MWKTKVRHFLVQSSFQPLLSVYRWMYRVAISASALVFRRCEGIVALYLCRGCTKNEITPGVSDIDFILIVGPDARQRRRAETAFRYLQIFSAGLIPYHPSFVMNEEELNYLWRATPVWRYRFQEGKQNWSLLQGRDALAALPPITDMERTASCFGEMNYWWAQFAEFLVQNESYRADIVLRKSICFKAVAEVLNALHGLRHGEFCYSRMEALRREDTELCRKLLAGAEQRVPRRDKAVEEEAYRFLVESFLGLWNTFRDRPFLPVYGEVEQTLEPASEAILREKGEAPFGAVCRYLAKEWSGSYHAVHLVKSAFYQIEESLLVIDTDLASLPSLDKVERLVDLRRRVYAGQSSATRFFLRIGQVAFPITPEVPRDFHRGVLTPATAPDVFLQLGDASVYWTSHTSWYLTDWQRNRQWLTASPLKRVQLEMISHSASAGHVRYPLDSRSLSR
ncbi:MAG TPA: hypothetical protein VGK29_02145 [Paludibaculum sp.]|jgi:hypothetical protein